MARLDSPGLHVVLFIANHCPSQPAGTPPNTLRCEGFKKTSDGTWYAEKSAPFDIGDTKEVTVERQVIGPGSHKIAGIDLYVLLERKCAGSRG